LIDLMAGRVPVMVSSLPAALPQIRAGKVRALAVTSAQRSSSASDLPTVAEATGYASYDASTWQGFVFPAATPRPVVQRVADETIAVLRLPDVRDRLRDRGYEPVGSTPAEFSAFIKRELPRWAKVIRSAGIKAQ
jgi:tripartite-type tricarboxylate transporter receptor subunit TctC